MAGAADVLTVDASGEGFALPAALVREVLRPVPLTRVPHAPAALLGLANLRGAVLPILSLARLLGGAEAPPGPAARIVVVEGAATVGLLVERVARLGPAGEARALDLPALLDGAFAGLARTAPRAAAPALPEAGPARAAEALALVAFGIAGQEYALPLDKVAEVARLPASAALGGGDGAILGLVPHRGGLLPLVLPHMLLGLPAGEPTAATRIVVTRLGAHRLGLVVDSMRAILRVGEEAVEPVPPILSRGLGEARVAAILRLDGGQRLVSVLSPAGLFDEATAARLAAGTEEEAMSVRNEAGAAERFVVFRLGEESYGLPIASVEEVVRHPGRLTRIPHAPDFVEGAMNLRGAVLPVIDQRRRFGSGDERQAGRIVVVTVEGLRAGFAVDAVSEVLPVAAEDLAPVPPLAEGDARVFDRVARVERGGRIILLIDPRALLDAAERDLLAAVVAQAPAVTAAEP